MRTAARLDIACSAAASSFASLTPIRSVTSIIKKLMRSRALNSPPLLDLYSLLHLASPLVAGL